MKHGFWKYLNATCCFVLIATASVEGVAGSNSYRWQNSSGETVYSDQPPTNGESYEVIGTPNSPKPVTSEATENATSGTTPGAGNDSGAVDNSNKSKEGASQEKSELCEKAKMQLVALDSNRQLTVRNDKGETKPLSEEEREIARQHSHQQIDAYCD